MKWFALCVSPLAQRLDFGPRADHESRARTISLHSPCSTRKPFLPPSEWSSAFGSSRLDPRSNGRTTVADCKRTKEPLESTRYADEQRSRNCHAFAVELVREALGQVNRLTRLQALAVHCQYAFENNDRLVLFRVPVAPRARAWLKLNLQHR
jgi:hypothetical protein